MDSTKWTVSAGPAQMDQVTSGLPSVVDSSRPDTWFGATIAVPASATGLVFAVFGAIQLPDGTRWPDFVTMISTQWVPGVTPVNAPCHSTQPTFGITVTAIPTPVPGSCSSMRRVPGGKVADG